ncbi:hypothetical protein PT974_05393 [Cladobotryum mycophilum]|uniref:DUF4440 domain-containing protein n=1 Tax=Cladobotryum mycophilum TaxID=491253 RepID=A0ABR0SJG4_9HYPO
MPRMYDRIREDLESKERSLWTALTSADPAPAVKKLCVPDANLLFPEMDIVKIEDEDDLDDAMQPPFHRFDKYELQDISIIIVGLMAGVVTYRVEASRGKHTYEATGSSTWGQGSDGEWRLAAHSETQM